MRTMRDGRFRTRFACPRFIETGKSVRGAVMPFHCKAGLASRVPNVR